MGDHVQVQFLVRDTLISVYVTSHPGRFSLAIPSWVGAMSTSQMVMMPYMAAGWRVKGF